MCVDDYIIDVKDKNSLNNLIVGIQKYDQYGNLPQEYSEAENAVSGVIFADKIAEGIKNGTIYEPVTTEKGQKLSEAIKNKYMMNKKQKG
ncbi:MAG: hypothetical protein ACI4OW_01550 [Alphaproteobacteria bacterium]